MIDDLNPLWQLVAAQFHSPAHSVHGPDHWRRVERNGLLLATRTGADVCVVRLFALFHDCRRENDGWDDGHGAEAQTMPRHFGVAHTTSTTPVSSSSATL